MTTANTETKKTKLAAGAAMLATAIIWGGGFAATKAAVDAGFSPMTVVFIRFGIASAAMAAVFNKKLRGLNKSELLFGLGAGAILFAGFFLQTAGMLYTTPSNNGFLTSAGVILVPIILWAVTKKPPAARVWAASALCLLGVFALTWGEGGSSFNKGDAITLGSALLFACHIVYLWKNAGRHDTAKLVFLQLLFPFLFSVPFMFTALAKFPAGREQFFGPGFAGILYLGFFSTALCYFLQTFAQKRVHAGTVSVILSTEALWGALFSILLGYELFTPGLAVGGVIIMLSVVLVELDDPAALLKKLFRRKEKNSGK